MTTDDSELLDRVDKLGQIAEGLTRCAGEFPQPLGSLVLLDALTHAQHSLAEVYAELAGWHETAAEGTHYQADSADFSGPERARTALTLAARQAEAAAETLQDARTANAATKWYDTVQQQTHSATRRNTASTSQVRGRLRAV
ncbi:MAG: hypothetical protein EPN48_11325 [Microbacteriaceae bacterium]|nr:MAG: hypothetical protein EPN48_11325 [Microbacteriaceae bacterium]